MKTITEAGMKKTTMEKNKIRRTLLGVLLTCAVVPRYVSGAKENSRIKPTSGKQMKKNLWQVVEELTKVIPFSKSSLEELFLIPLIEARKNTYTVFYEGQSVKLNDGVVIKKIDLRIGLNESHPGFLVLDLGGACLSLDNVHSRFKATEITQIPTGRSVDEATVHTSMHSWGTLSFGFREKDPNCLAYIAFDPRKN